jgi:hypothetical protein
MRESKRVLSGSLNLLAPGDKIPEADGTQMQNWRVDQNGALVGRGGLGLAWPGAVDAGGIGQYVHTMARRASTYYFGCGTHLYRANQVGPIQTGFDGNPIGSCAYAGYSWFMNQGAQIRDDGTNVNAWGVVPPTNAILPGAAIPDPGGPTAGLQGTYQWYWTFYYADGSESNPSPVSLSQMVAGDIYLLFPTFTTNALIVGRNIYRTGGTLGQAYQVGSINDLVTFLFLDSMSDLTATLLGIPMPINHDPPPAAAGCVGPYLGYFLLWNATQLGAPRVNRMWYSLPNQPQYFPGAQLTTGQWFDVGDDGEAILTCVAHASMLVIYKERSIWRLIGDPITGYLQRSDASTGTTGVNGACGAGQYDYLIGTEGLYSFDGDTATRISTPLDPIFRGANASPVVISASLTVQPMDYSQAYRAAIGYADGRIYFSYAEVGQTGNSTALIYHIASQRWYTWTTEPGEYAGGFTSFLYVNPAMWVGGLAIAGQLESGFEDAYQFAAVPVGATGAFSNTAISLEYQSRYEDCGKPDNQKVFLDVTIEASGCTSAVCAGVTVQVVYDNGASVPLTLGTLTNSARGKTTFPLSDDGSEAFNMAVRLECSAFGNQVTIYSIYFSYYVEARLTETVATIPVDLGHARVKQIKEIQADIDCSNGPAALTIQSDLPGNQIATRDTLVASQSTGRRMFQLPTTQTWTGRLWSFAVNSTSLFRLYGLRALVRPLANFVEAYEAAAGYVWDSLEQDMSHLKRFPADMYRDPVKRAKNLQFDIEADGAITAQLYSDLPSGTMTLAFTQTIPASGARQIVTLPLPQGLTPMIEGRLFRLKLAGTQQYILYDARLEVIEMGAYIEAVESAGGATYDSREMDFGSAKVKEARELQMDIETTGNVTAQVLSDFPGFVMQVVATKTFATSGRQKVHLVLPQLEGRLWRLLISGSAAFRMYGARLELRQFGEYLDSSEAGQGGFWDTTELDLGTRSAKEIRDIELDLWAYAQITVNLLLDLPGDTMTTQLTVNVPATGGRRKFSVPLPENSPYLFGRLARVTVTGAGAFKLFGARINWRPIGTYVEAYEGQAGAIWDSTVVTIAGGKDVVVDQLRFELDAPNPVECAIYTDLPGEKLTLRWTAILTTGTSGRSWATVEMPGGIAGDTEGRVIRVTLSSNADFRVYQGQTFCRQIGRYLAANVSDTFRTLDWDAGTERVKTVKKLEADFQTDGPLTLTLFTNQTGSMAAQYTTVVNTGGLRQTLEFVMPINIRGRLARVEITGASSGRLYGLRLWMRPLNEPGASWSWAAFPMEESQTLAEWKPLPVEPTPAEFQWSDLPVQPTSPVWAWSDFNVSPTDPQWTWGEFNVEPTTDKFEWVDIPIGEA